MASALRSSANDRGYKQSHEGAHRHDAPDGIAIIGYDLRFPQEGGTPEGFWKMMEERQSAMTDFPSERVNIDAFHDPTSTRAGTLRMRGGHFIQGDVAAFDADFFSIHTTEACAMDPQQRMLLETAYRAFESAGVRLEDLRGSRTSVLTGCFTNDYFNQTLKDPQDFPSYMAIGATLAMLANRLSWFFDLEGPSYNVDAACASSALAIQQACEQLQRGDCDMALAAGCNLMLDPDFGIALGNMQFMSPDSRSFSFDSRGNGYARGEGVAVLVLKRVVDAVRDKDPIRAVIRACKSNSDGRTPGITQPSSEAQLKLIEETYRAAGLAKSETRFFEAHGTGTPIGDPAEANAIIKAFQSFRTADDPLYIGAVKSFIGHLEGAAGIAAVIKSIMSLEAGVILPNINFEKVNPQIYNTGSCIRFPLECVPWPKCPIRRASMSCFGYGGTNCHIIIDDAYSYLTIHNLPGIHVTNMLGFDISSCSKVPKNIVFPSDHKGPSVNNSGNRRLLVWSANDEQSLTRMVDLWKSYAVEKATNDSSDEVLLVDMEKTLLHNRTLLKHRSFTVVDSVKSIERPLEVFLAPKKAKPPGIAFVFTGQGAQWSGMGRELMCFKKFADVIGEATSVLASIGSTWSVKEMLMNEMDRSIDDPEYAAPLTTILQIALVELLRQTGVQPVAVAGHSVGEIAAAYSAGAITRYAAYILAYYRGKFVSTVPSRDSIKGGMMSVGVSEEQITAYFDKVTAPKSKYSLTASCINSTENITVSGELQQLDELEALLQDQGVFARKLRVNAAYHSRQLEQIAPDCLEHYRKIEFEPRRMTLPMISTMTGESISQGELANPQYWIDDMIAPVLFKQAVQRICTNTEEMLTKKLDRSHRNAIVADHIIEIGPHSALKLPIQQTLASIRPARSIRYSTVLTRKQPADQTFLQLLGTLYCLGLPVSLDILGDRVTGSTRPTEPKILIDAPKYPFNHSKTYWHESHISRSYRLRPFGFVEGLGHRVRDWRSFAPEWRNRVSISESPWLSAHTIGGTTLYPAAAMIMMAVKGAIQLTANPRLLKGLTLDHVSFSAPIVFPNPSTIVEIRLIFLPTANSAQRNPTQWSFQILSLNNDKWKLNCSGSISTHQDEDFGVGWHAAPLLADFKAISQKCIKAVQGNDFYRKLGEQGFQYGSEFQGIIDALYEEHGSAIARVQVHDDVPEHARTGVAPHLLHPRTLDSIFQSLLLALSKGGEDSISGSVVKGLGRIWMSTSEESSANAILKVCSSLGESTRGDSSGDMFALDETEGRVIMLVRGMEATKIVSQADTQIASIEGAGPCTIIRTVADPDTCAPDESLNQVDMAEVVDETVNGFTDAISILVGHDSAIQRSLANELLSAVELRGKNKVTINTLADDTATRREILISLLEYDNPFLSTLDRSTFEQLRAMLSSAQKVVWVTKGAVGIRGPGFGMSQGFFRCFERENPMKQASIVELDWISPDQRSAVESILQVLHKVQRSTATLEEVYSASDNALGVSRQIDDVATMSAISSIMSGHHKSHKALQQSRPFVLKSRDEDSFAEALFQYDTSADELGHPDQVEIRVTEICGAKQTAQRLAADPEAQPPLSGYAGKVSIGSMASFKPGDRVCCLARRGIRSNIRVATAQVARIPDKISSSDAVSILHDVHLAFHIAQKCIRIAPGDSLLITGSETFLRHAVITLAVDLGSSVYVATRDEEDGKRIEGVFSQSRVAVVPRQDIIGSIKRLKPRGVDAIIDLSENTLGQDLIDRVSPFGQVVLLSGTPSVSIDATVPSNICIRTVTRDCIQDQSYNPHAVSLQSLLDRVLKFDPVFDAVRSFPVSKIRDAERQVFKNGPNENVVVRFEDGDILTLVKPIAQRYQFSPDVSYLIAGGLGDLGRCLARWMVSRGARNLILLSRSGPKSKGAMKLVDELESNGVRVVMPCCDVSDTNALAKSLAQCNASMPPIKGCIQASGVVRDISYDKMDFEDWQAAVRPKVNGSWNLHQLLPDDLDFFILTSSISGILGQATQINYAAGNTYQDALARYRVSLGQKTVSLDLGLLMTGGMVAENSGLLERILRKQELNPLSEQQIIAIFDHFCDPETSITEPWQSQLIVGIRKPREILADTGIMPRAMYKPTWSLLRPSDSEMEEILQQQQERERQSQQLQDGQHGTRTGGSTDQRGPARQLEELIAAATAGAANSSSMAILSSPSLRTEAAAIVTAGLAGCVSRLLAIPEASVSVEQALHVYGADSITALDVRAWIAKTFAVDVPVFDLLGDDTSIAETGAVIAGLWLEERGKKGSGER